MDLKRGVQAIAELETGAAQLSEILRKAQAFERYVSDFRKIGSDLQANCDDLESYLSDVEEILRPHMNEVLTRLKEVRDQIVSLRAESVAELAALETRLSFVGTEQVKALSDLEKHLGSVAEVLTNLLRPHIMETSLRLKDSLEQIVTLKSENAGRLTSLDARLSTIQAETGKVLSKQHGILIFLIVLTAINTCLGIFLVAKVSQFLT